MNKIIIPGIVAIILASLGGVYVVQKSSQDALMAKEQNMQDAASVEKVHSDEALKADQAKDAMMAKSGDTTQQNADQMSDKAMTAHTGSEVMTQNGAMMHAGSYEAYSPEKIAMKAASGKVVLFFHASWCPTCRALDADIKAHLGAIPENLTILDVDYDTSTNLKARYGVTYQHTFVEVDAQGSLVKKWSGSPTLGALVAEVK